MIDDSMMFGIHRISRYCRMYSESEVLFVTSFFYTKLELEGAASVDSWFEGCNLFKRKFVIVPVNRQLHWILLIIINPGLLASTDTDGGETCCILALDSLKINKKQLSKYCAVLSCWLNREWAKTHPNSVNNEIKIFAPSGT